MQNLVNMLNALGEEGGTKLGELLSNLTEAGAGSYGTFTAQASESESREMAEWLRDATPEQLQRTADFFNGVRPPIARNAMDWLRKQKQPGANGQPRMPSPDRKHDATPPAKSKSDPVTTAPPTSAAKPKPKKPPATTGKPEKPTTTSKPAISRQKTGLWRRVAVPFVGLWKRVSGLFGNPVAKSNRRIDRAWALLDSDPAAALDEFDSLIEWTKHQARGKARFGDILRRAFVGRTLANVAIGEFEEAHTDEERSREFGPLTHDEQAELCCALLVVEHNWLHHFAIAAFARYLEFPADRQDSSVRDRVVSSLCGALAPPTKEGRDRMERAVAVARRLTEKGGAFGWAYLPLARTLEQLQKYSESAEAYQNASTVEPEQPECYAGLGRTRTRLGDARGARAAWLKAYGLSLDTDSAYNAARACLDTPTVAFSAAEQVVAGDTPPLEYAAGLLRFMTEAQPRNYAAWAALGEVEWKSGRPAEAIGPLQTALELDSKGASTHAVLGRCKLTLGDLPGASESAANALRIAPMSDNALLLSGDVAHDEDRFADAVGFYRRVRVTPSEPPTVDRMARSHLKAGDPSVGVDLLSTQRTLSTDARLVLGRSLARLDRWEDAADELAKVKSPPSASYRYYLGAALAGAGRYADAEKQLLVVRDDPNYRDRATRQLGHLKLRLQDFSAARALYLECPDADADLGRLALVQGQVDEARTRFDSTLTADPSNAVAKLGRALALAADSDTEAIEELLDDPQLGPDAHERLSAEELARGRYVAAFEHLEKARVGRPRLSDAMLAGLATCYLQMGRFTEALPHLVELGRRRPNHSSIRRNLALCRYHIGMSHVRQERWEPGYRELTQAAALFKTSDMDVAVAVGRWASEAGYRTVTEQIPSGPPEMLSATLAIIDVGCEEEPENPRWPFASGLAHARGGFFADAAADFLKGQELCRHRAAGFVLGRGLSLQGDGKDEAAALAFEETIRLCEAPANGTTGLLMIAARFALAKSRARVREWERAADSLGAVLDHPLIRSSSRIGQADVAQSMAVYFALAGLKANVADLVSRFSGKISGAIGDVLAGLVQAEAGDYSGAAETLGRAYESEQNPAVKQLLVACLLAAAGEAIKQGKAERASTLVAKARKFAPSDADAARLADAIVIYLQMQRLDPSQLDNAIGQCEKMMKGDKPAAQLVRSLGVLYHRKAVEAEHQNKSPDKAWDQCLGFWKKHILKKDKFWEQFVIEYNLGKGRREQLKPEDTTGWRKGLPLELAAGHLGRLLDAIRANDKAAVKRHARLIGAWDPGYEPPEGFAAEMSTLTVDQVGLAESAAGWSDSPALRTALNNAVGGYWNGKALPLCEDVARWINNALAAANESIQRLNDLGSIYKEPRTYVDCVQRMRAAEAVFENARTAAQEARGYARKATRLAPENQVYKENLAEIEKALVLIKGNISWVKEQLRKVVPQ